jgi:TrmH family RNA methyltransferase
MKNMGFGALRLVEPRPYERDDLLRVAHHAEDVVDAIAIFPDLDAALADVRYVVGTAAADHPAHRATTDVRGLAADLLRRAAAERIALLFGPEADGLALAALDRCHLTVSLPTNPAYPALNLAQSVLLLLYELRMADTLPAPAPMPAPPAPQADLERLFAVAEETLAEVGFFKYDRRPVLRSLRQMAYRAALTPADVALLLAIARQTQWTVRNPRRPD